MNRIKAVTLLATAALLGALISTVILRPDGPHEQVNSSILLERIRPVLKLVTVEGDFNEVYTYHDARAAFEWLETFAPFQKRAMLRIQARVSVGYDLEGMDLVADEQAGTMTLRGMDAPTLLAMEHDVDYYDLESGTFNPFTPQDLTRMEAQAKELVRRRIPESGLLRVAAERKQDMITVVRSLVESAGWTFVDATGTTKPAKG